MSAKLALLIFALVLLCALYLSMPSNLADAVEVENAQITIYCRAYDGSFVANGSGCIVQTSYASLHSDLKKSHQVDGISLVFDGSQGDIDKLIAQLNVQTVKSENVDGIVCIYGYSPKLQRGIVVDGRQINVQFAYSNGTVTVGSPLILGSY